MSKINHNIEWQGSLKIGDERIDAQHRQVFELLSEIVDSCLDGSSEKILHKVLDFFIDYTAFHFSDEESLQMQYDYPQYKEHKQQHDEFKVKVRELAEKFKNEGSTKELSDNVNKIVLRWLVIHIIREDMKLGRYIKTKTVFNVEPN